MSVRLVAGEIDEARGHVYSVVRVLDDADQLVFADRLALDRAADRQAFARQVLALRPEADLAAVEAGLLKLFEEASRPAASQDAGEGADAAIRLGSQSTRLMELAKELVLFHTPDRTPYATLPVGSHKETWPLGSAEVKDWLSRRFYLQYQTVPNAQALADALGPLRGTALYEGPEREVCTRVAELGGHVYLDLGDAEWRVVEISIVGWRVIAEAPIPFRRPHGLLALPEPQHGGNLNLLRPFANLGRGPEADDAFRLLLTWLVMTLCPSGPYPVLQVHGEQGSGKSLVERLLRRCIDPNAAPLRSQPRDEGDLVLAALNGWIVGLDNLSYLPDWLSDGLCRLATGGGLGKRQLYTDLNEVLVNVQRPVLLNGIEDVATRPDLQDRSISLWLKKLSKRSRRSEKRLWREFAAIHGQVLGALLDVAVHALAHQASIPEESLPRMADFGIWGAAAAPALGWTAAEFLAALEANRRAANDTALGSSPLVGPLRQLLETGPWEGLVTDLLTILDDTAGERARKHKQWPKDATRLSGALRRLAPALRIAGIEVEFPERIKDGQPVRIARRDEADDDDADDDEPPDDRGPDPESAPNDEARNHNHTDAEDTRDAATPATSASPEDSHDDGAPAREPGVADLQSFSGRDVFFSREPAIREAAEHHQQALFSDVARVAGSAPSSGSGVVGVPDPNLQADLARHDADVAGVAESAASSGNGTDGVPNKRPGIEPAGGVADVAHLQPSSADERREFRNRPPAASRPTDTWEANDADVAGVAELPQSSAEGAIGTDASSGTTPPAYAAEPGAPEIKNKRSQKNAQNSYTSYTAGATDPEIDAEFITEASRLATILPELMTATVVGVDTETTGLDPRSHRLRLVQLATAHGTYVIDAFHVDVRALAPLFAEGPPLRLHNGKFDLQFLGAAGLPVPDGARLCDTMLAAQLMSAGTELGRLDHCSLASVVERALGITLDKTLQRAEWTGELSTEQRRYAGRDAAILLPLGDRLEAELAEARLQTAARLEMGALPALAWLEQSGAPFDAEAWQALSNGAVTEQVQLEHAMARLVGALDLLGDSLINWASPPQVLRLLRERGHELAGTDEATLQSLARRDPLVPLLLQHREATRKASTYGIDFLRHVHAATGRLHPDYLQLGAATGRMACSKPNLQQVPRDLAYRACFRPGAGRVLIKADYSQIELRIAAELAGDARMIAAYQRGEDLHAVTAASVLGRTGAVRPEDRQAAKALNFGLIYGMGANTLREHAASGYGVTLSGSEAARFRDRFFNTYPGLWRWHRSQPEGSVATRTLAGRRRLGVSRYTEKLNTPVQGSGADGLKAALALLWETRDRCPSAVPVLCIHDEIDLECDASEAEAASEWLIDVMTQGLQRFLNKVPVVVEAHIAADWSGAQ